MYSYFYKRTVENNILQTSTVSLIILAFLLTIIIQFILAANNTAPSTWPKSDKIETPRENGTHTQ